jgi:TonB family protein
MRHATRWLLLLMVVMALTVGPIAQDAPPRITPEQAKDFRGKVVTVCGRIDGVTCNQGFTTRITFTPSGFPVSSATEGPTTIVAPDAIRSASGIAPEPRFDRQLVCATGLARQGTRGEEIVLGDLSGIWVEQTLTPPLATQAHWPCEDGVTMPTVLRDVKPNYTAEAMRARAQGVVRMQGVVEADGLVGNVRVTRSLHPEIDAEAVKAFKGWQFRPGTFRGQPAAVVVVTEMTFTLRSRAQP